MFFFAFFAFLRFLRFLRFPRFSRFLSFMRLRFFAAAGPARQPSPARRGRPPTRGKKQGWLGCGLEGGLGLTPALWSAPSGSGGLVSSVLWAGAWPGPLFPHRTMGSQYMFLYMR